MALSAKPTRPTQKVASPDPIEAFISKGGSVPTPVPEEREAKGAQHPLKFPAGSDLFERLEQARSASVVKLPRNTWILQAIAEKLARDT
ncbi:hypothetical protein FF100_36535 [Methylobacterium terricola]|uniref:Uncharacterized protein n=1 Tax=Methylobacterium terricola TaxID=2583531 RepID=A0A5C4L4J4_9HYPH|nr:hypothetical protein [Methylobacterium terricola]TNC04556.1 hypothetical protein FF100_36535 [Methylobacterium terricola]